ncbi:hypothetical protein C8R43DRAFT_863419, partial [Mycena crocata]
IKRSLPIWFHSAAKNDLNHLNNSTSSKCLRTIHGVLTVGDLMSFTTGESPRHSRRKNCACPACKYDRNLGCIKPYMCREEALKLLDCIHPKWDPRHHIHESNPGLTDDELSENQKAFEEKKAVIFDTNITLQSSIKLAFRVF